jgi:hypothetical protein
LADRLTAQERHTLDQCEASIDAYRRQYLRVAEALATIRDGRLYRGQYGTFEDYCEQRWGFSRRRGYQLIDAAAACEPLVHADMPAPATERVARELARLSDVQERAEVWAQARNDAAGAEPTAAEVAALAARARAGLPLAAEEQAGAARVSEAALTATAAEGDSAEALRWFEKTLGPGGKADRKATRLTRRDRAKARRLAEEQARRLA